MGGPVRLAGKRVLVTRPAGQAAAFSARLRELGAEPILAPAIVIGPPDDPTAARAAVARVRDYAWVVFTSANGVRAFFDRVSDAGHDARAVGEVKIAAIGPATATALGAHGVRVDFLPEEYVGEAVAAGLIARTKAGDRVLLFRAQEAREVLPAGLRAAARVCDDVAGYAARPVDDPEYRIKLGDADIVTFASASAVHGLIANVPDAVDALRGTIVACIGPVTAAAARAAGLTVNVVADEFTADGLVRALEAGVPV